MQQPFRLGVDIGGTFTDLLLVDDATGRLTIGKTLTTPADPSQAVETALGEALTRIAAGAGALRYFVHGTTLVTNAIIERRGAPTALLTTQGFRDALEIGREHRYELYDLSLEHPRPLVPRYLRFEARERTLADGSVRESLDLDEVEQLVRELWAKGIRALAVCLLHSYRNPTHERAIGELAARVAPEMRVTLSHEVVAELREFERTSTAVANVYVQELVAGYLRALEARLAQRGFGGRFYVMLSNGGLGTLETAERFPIRLLESGPAAGALAAAAYGRAAGRTDLLSFDMGGTTAKLCIIDRGRPLLARQFEVDRVYRFKRGSGLPVKIPVIDMIEIGAGGGSVASVDALGLLKVGPESSGAEPGPACYGRGGREPTVTDADLVLGYLDPEYFLGGRMRLDVPAARAALARLAHPLGMSVEQVAWGIHQVVNESMANAARVHAVERGKDARRLPLFAFGGAGPVHGYRVAELLSVPELLVPLGAGVTSTVGFLAAPLAFDFARSAPGRLDALDWTVVGALLAEMEAEGRALLLAAGVAEAEMRVERSVDMRYLGQGYEVPVPLPEGPLDARAASAIAEAFEQVYRALYGRGGPRVPLEVITWRLTVSGPEPPLRLGAAPQPSEGGGLKGERSAYFPEAGGFRPTPVFDRYVLAAGQELRGPAIVEERESTVVIGPDRRAYVDEQLNLVVELG